MASSDIELKRIGEADEIIDPRIVSLERKNQSRDRRFEKHETVLALIDRRLSNIEARDARMDQIVTALRERDEKIDRLEQLSAWLTWLVLCQKDALAFCISSFSPLLQPALCFLNLFAAKSALNID